MCESDLEYARKKILSGKVPLVMTPQVIKKYRRKRVFWFILGLFVLGLFGLNAAGYLLPAFWGAILFFLPAFGLLIGLRASVVKSAEADMAIIAFSILFYGLAAAYGMLAVHSPAADYLPTILVRAAEALP